MFGLVGGSIQRNCGGHASCRAGSKSEAVKPLTERIFSRSLGKFKRFIAGATLGAMLATGVGASFAGCGRDNARVEDSVKEEAKTRIASTDEEGKAVFEVDGKKFNVVAVDAETGQPIENLQVFFRHYKKTAFFRTLDPLNRYPSRIAFSSQEAGQASSSAKSGINFGEEVIRFSLQTVGSACRMATSLITQQSFENAAVLSEQYLEDNFVKATENPVRLRDLNNVMSLLSGAAVDQAVGEGIEQGLIHVLGVLGFKVAKVVEGAGVVLLFFDVCAMGESLNYADFYKRLCYEDNDTFQVWKWRVNDVNVSVGNVNLTLAANPIFLVTPTTPREDRNLDPPTAKILGYVTDRDTGRALESVPVEIKHMNESGEFEAAKPDIFLPRTGQDGYYSGFVGVCGAGTSRSTEVYRLRVAKSGYKARTTGNFTVEPNFRYQRDFRLRRLNQNDFCNRGDRDRTVPCEEQPVMWQLERCTPNHYTIDYTYEMIGECDLIECSPQQERQVRCDTGIQKQKCVEGWWRNDGTCTPPPCTNNTYYQDRDRDTFGDPNSPKVFCTVREATDSGYVANSEDCNDRSRAVGRYVEKQIVPCNRGRGWSVATCSRGVWAPGVCEPLTSGGGSSGSSEEEPAPECVEGEVRGVECTVEERAGVRVDSCVANAWVEGVCEPLAECADGEEKEESCTASGRVGTRVDVCAGGFWVEGTCAPVPECADGETRTLECTNTGGRTGSRTDSCVSGFFAEGECRGSECADGERRTEPCGYGTRVDSCTIGWWVESTCPPEPTCTIIRDASIGGPDQYAIHGNTVAIQSDNNIYYINLDSFVQERIPTSPDAYVQSPISMWGDSVYFRMVYASSPSTALFMQFNVSSGELTTLFPMLDSGMIVTEGSIASVYEETAVTVHFPLGIYAFNVNDEPARVTEIHACNPETRQLYNPLIYGDVLVAKETNHPNTPGFTRVYGYNLDGSSCWQVSGEEPVMGSISMYSDSVAYNILITTPLSGSYYATVLNSVYGGEETVISLPETNPQGSVRIWGTKIAYDAYPIGPIPSYMHVFVYDASTGETRDYGQGISVNIGERGVIFAKSETTPEGQRYIGVAFCETE